MGWTQWLIFILIIQLIHGLGTWKLYVKAGRQAWEAFYVILLFVPIVNLIMVVVVWVETARSFGKNTFLDTFLAIITLGFYNYYLNYFADVSYVEDRDLHPKSSSGDWVSSILFAVVAATIVHTYFIQPYTIPTSSLEKTLLVGDFLFVSKMHYGARAPMTTVSLPMVHDAMPFTQSKSYLHSGKKDSGSLIDKLQLPYFRFPGFQKIKRNDIVVFSWPVDTLTVITDPTSEMRYKPIDKKSNYVKRCVGVPGDSLEVRNGYVYINGKQNELPDRAKLQFSYIVETKNGEFNPNQLKKRYDISDRLDYNQNKSICRIAAVTDEAYSKVKNHPNVGKIVINKAPKGERDPNIFPKDPAYNWNNDHFGPLYIPKEGETINLNLETLPLYKRAITEYEGNNLDVKGNQIFINGDLASNYTFKQDYYWMMGDNRHNSQDSRTWGLVPFDHVVGKPVFIWMSWDGLKNPRWKRFFTTVGGSGKPVSYFIPFVVLLLGWFGFNKWRKRS